MPCYKGVNPNLAAGTGQIKGPAAAVLIGRKLHVILGSRHGFFALTDHKTTTKSETFA